MPRTYLPVRASRRVCHVLKLRRSRCSTRVARLQLMMRLALPSEVPEVSEPKRLSIPAPDSPQARYCGAVCPSAALSPAIHAHHGSLSLIEVCLHLLC